MEISPEVQDIRIPEHPVHPIFLNRWSPRAFSPEPLSDETVGRLFEAAKWAASSYNEQPWRFLVGRTPEDHARILSVLIPFNQLWAKNAPLLVLSVAKKTFAHNGTPNRVAVHDVGAASAYLILAATELGLYAHGMAGFDVAAARSVLEIPDDYEPLAVWAIGHRGNKEDLPPEAQAREAPSPRKSQAEFVFEGKFPAAP